MPTASQSWPERVMNRLRSSTDEGLDMLSFDTRRLLLSLLLGLIGGLLLGLFLGWVVWPVQWSNTRPAHLEPDAKAQFIASVADAYVATGGDPVALKTAQMRLLGMEIADFEMARSYFANTIAGSAQAQNPELDNASDYRRHAERVGISFDSNIRLNNINQLALDLGIPAGANTAGNALSQPVQQVQIDTQPLDNAAQTVEQTTNQSINNTTSTVAENTGNLFGGLGRAVYCLTALMLVLGGVYILVRLNQRMQWVQNTFGRVQGSDTPVAAVGRNFNEESYEQVEIGYGPADSARRGPVAPIDDEFQFERDDLSFDPESVHADTELDAPDGFDDDPDDRYDHDVAQSRIDERRGEYRSYDDERPETPERYTDVGPAAISAQQPSSIPASVPQPPRQYQSHEQLDEQRLAAESYAPVESDEPDHAAFDDYRRPDTSSQWADDDMPDLPPITDFVEPPDEAIWPVSAPSDARRRGGDPATSSTQSSVQRASGDARPARTRRKVLEYTAQYKRGERVEYEENQHIFVDDDGTGTMGRNVGECGLGVNFKNGILLNNPHDVIALDVWLLDKVKTEMLTSVKRILISEYVIERNLEEVIQREIHSDGEPLVPQPGLEFELQGANLSLTCRVQEASYVQDGEQPGVFNTLAMQMTVYANI